MSRRLHSVVNFDKISRARNVWSDLDHVWTVLYHDWNDLETRVTGRHSRDLGRDESFVCGSSTPSGVSCPHLGRALGEPATRKGDNIVLIAILNTNGESRRVG